MSETSVVSRIKQHDVLNVGVSLGFKGLSLYDSIHQRWDGFDIDLARAVAIAVLGNDNKINFLPLQSADRFKALRDASLTWVHLIQALPFGVKLNLVSVLSIRCYLMAKY